MGTGTWVSLVADQRRHLYYLVSCVQNAADESGSLEASVVDRSVGGSSVLDHEVPSSFHLCTFE